MVLPNTEEATRLEEWRKELKKYTFRQQTVNILMANYFANGAHKEILQTFTEESGAHPTVDLCFIDEREQIINIINHGYALEALALVDKLFPDFLSYEPTAKFLLLQLHLIELIRLGDIESALMFAQTLPSEIVRCPSNVYEEIERTMTLLAFENPRDSPDAALLEQGHRERVAHTVNESILSWNSYGSHTSEMLHLFKIVLWAQAELSENGIRFQKLEYFPSAAL